jgi:BCD family chlorophyll transporter-like MFS transporter
MAGLKRHMLDQIVRIGPQWLPFADAATDDVPLSRLLRLSLFQVSVGLALALVLGTLNRVMIVELAVPASVVALMLALPLVFAPFRALIGFKSDAHVSALGWRRVPWIWKGTMMQWGGFAVMPFALLVLSGYGEAADLPAWIGLSAAGLAFLMVGAGVNTVQTVGLALATDLVREEDHPKVVGLMYVMLLAGMIFGATAYGALLENYTPGRLIQVIQGTAVASLILNSIALWKQEPRDRARAAALAQAKARAGTESAGFSQAWRAHLARRGTLPLLVVIGLGTAGFGMADVLLEPYGGSVLGLSVASTTRLTAWLAAGGLAGFILAARILAAGFNPLAMALLGASTGLPAFGAIIVSAQAGLQGLFVPGILLAGFGAGLFSHGTLTAAMRNAPREQAGLALGAWGSVQATAGGAAIAVGGLMRDGLAFGGSAASSFAPVFALEMALLAAAVLVAGFMLRGRDPGTGKRQDETRQDNTRHHGTRHGASPA